MSSTCDAEIVGLELGGSRYEFADAGMKRVISELRMMARTRLPILILGETGVGKEVLARAAHHLSKRHGGPFVCVNCAAIPAGLMESELFGHQRGAYSGAATARAGYFESADGGTLFLDEIGELDLEAQVRLLRVLSEHRVARLGSTMEQRVDVRVVAATNRDLDAQVSSGRFREDLYHRICGATLHVPPLRQRADDLPRLARQFLSSARAELERADAELTEAAMRIIRRHGWPGNVRELKNAMVYAAAAATSDVVDQVHLPARLLERDARAWQEPARDDTDEPVGFRPIAEEIDELVERRMRQALRFCGGVQSAAAALLGMPRRTFITRMREFGIEPATVSERRALRNRGTKPAC